ncbi:hypothetical protein M405DRAFT_938363, partial [Rhizopogon salebrosus TDB-379]
MNAAYSSSTAPQVTENELPSTEDASLEGLQAAEPAVHPPQETRHERDNKPSLQEILQMTSTTMSFISTISTLFDDQEVQSSRFREELKKRILIAAMNTHAWASARAVHEHAAARDTLTAGIQKLVEDEGDQGRSSHLVPKSTFDRMRARLSEMFEAINNTVANLTGLY